MRADQPSEPAEQVNRLDAGSGTGDVVQARDVHGGVHFHQQVEAFAVTPRQLPGPVQGFVNRDAELASLAKVIAEEDGGSLVVVIAGTAGVGKTSLALRWAHGVRDRFPDGQLYVNLRGYDPGPPATPDHVLGRFLRDLGVPARAVPTDPEERAAMYRSVLAGRKVLVVLDNAATVGQVRPLLPGSPGCLAVVTSRSRLSGLVAREGARRLHLDLLSDGEAVDLLRAVTAGQRPEDPEAELAELARLCARLPLALRIAAERAASRPHLPLSALISDLRDESGLWDALTADGAGDADAVRTVFAWSYRALPESAAAMFRRLGLHPGSEFSLPAAAAVAGIDVRQARHDLDALVGAHLIEHSGIERYEFHDLLRAYAIDQLRQSEDDDNLLGARRRVLTWYLLTADAAVRRIDQFDRYVLDQSGLVEVEPLAFPSYDSALRWLRVEATNLAAAVHAAASSDQHGIAWRLAAVLRIHYAHQNVFDDWIATARIGAESAARIGDRTGEAEAHESLGKAYFQSRRLAEAGVHHQQALAIRRELGDRLGEGVSVNALGLLAMRRRDLAEAANLLQQGERTFAELGERRWVALLRGNLAEVRCEQNDIDGATELLEDVLPVFRELGNRFVEGNALFLLARAHRAAGRLAEARAAIEEALEVADNLDSDLARAYWLVELGRIQIAAGEPGQALECCQRAAVIQRRLGDRSREATAWDVAGLAYQRLDRHDEAADFHRRAATVHRELGDRWQQAAALDHLATVLVHSGRSDQAQQCRHQALSLLDGFDDLPAEAVRERLTRELAGH